MVPSTLTTLQTGIHGTIGVVYGPRRSSSCSLPAAVQRQQLAENLFLDMSADQPYAAAHSRVKSLVRIGEPSRLRRVVVAGNGRHPQLLQTTCYDAVTVRLENRQEGDMATGNRHGVILPMGWYNFEVVSYRTGLSKAGDSTNYMFELVCRSENERFNGVRNTHHFSSKALGFMVPFLEACGAIDYVHPFPRLFPRLRFNLTGQHSVTETR